MNFLKKSLVITISLLAITGCNKNSEFMTTFDSPSIYKDSSVNIYLNSFSDHRTGEALILPTGSEIIYAYQPEMITNGELLSVIGYDLYNSLDKERKTFPTSIGIDVSVRDVESVIRHGTLSRMGYYYAKIQTRVIVKDSKTDEVIAAFPIVATKSKVRTSTTGRVPSAQEDRKATVKVLSEAGKELSELIMKEAEEPIAEYIAMKKELAIAIDQGIIDKKVDIPSVKEDKLDVSPDIIEQLEKEEQKLLYRKEQQRLMYEEKLLKQKDTIQ